MEKQMTTIPATINLNTIGERLRKNISFFRSFVCLANEIFQNLNNTNKKIDDNRSCQKVKYFL